MPPRAGLLTFSGSVAALRRGTPFCMHADANDAPLSILVVGIPWWCNAMLLMVPRMRRLQRARASAAELLKKHESLDRELDEARAAMKAFCSDDAGM